MVGCSAPLPPPLMRVGAMCPKKMASLILLINFVLDTSFLPAQESLVIKVINMSVAYDLSLAEGK